MKKSDKYNKYTTNYSNGLTYHPLKKRYWNMIYRCYNKDYLQYKNYGGIGVTVCKEWLPTKYGGDPGNTGLINFISDMENLFFDHKKKNKTTQLDKDILCKKYGINPPVYSKETCLFITAKENCKHRKLK